MFGSRSSGGSAPSELVNAYANGAPMAGTAHARRGDLEDLARLADTLLDHARGLRRQYGQLEHALSEAGVSPSAEPPGEDLAHARPGTHGRPSSPATGADDEGTADVAPGASERSVPSDDVALLIALDMALNGAPRDEAAAHLREAVGIDRDDIVEEPYAKVGAVGVAVRPAGSG
jgi:hypothetical protein